MNVADPTVNTSGRKSLASLACLPVAASGGMRGIPFSDSSTVTTCLLNSWAEMDATEQNGCFVRFPPSLVSKDLAQKRPSTRP